MEGFRAAPDVLASTVLAIPTRQEIEAIALRAFSGFVKKQVGIMVSRQAVYNMSGIRGDGHNDLASRVRMTDPETGRLTSPFTAILAWCGIDGSLLKPPVLSHGESIEEQVEDLTPLLILGRDERMAYGMSLLDARPAFHSTDTYNKHRLQWPHVYDSVCMCQRVCSEGTTPRSDVSKAKGCCS